MQYRFQRDDAARTINVLHVDDEETHLMLTKHYIEEYVSNIRLTSKQSVKEALDMDLSSFDCILSDYSMPEMTGIDFAVEVKRRTAVPFILYTGKGSEEISAEAYAMGIDSYQRKEPNPSHYHVLAIRLKNLVEKDRAVAELRDSWNTSSELIENFPSGLFIYQYKPSGSLVLLWSNSVAEELTGIDIEEYQGKEYLEIWHSLKGVALRDTLIECIVRDQPYKSTSFLFNENNRERYLRINAFPISNNRIVVSFENITERIKYENRLEALLHHIIELDSAKTVEEIASIGFKLLKETLDFNSGRFYTRRDDYFVLVAAGLEQRLTGDELPPNVLDAFLSGKTIQRLNDDSTSQIVLAVPIKINNIVECVLSVKNKKSTTVSPQDINLVEILSLQISSAIRRIYEVERLEELVSERTQKLLDNERLVTAGKIISMMGHDLRSPLQSIVNSVYIMKNDQSQWDRFYPTIEDSAVYAIKILEDLQHLTRKAPIRKYPTDLGHLIKQSLDSNHIPDGVSVSLDVDSCVELVAVDPVQIRRVLDNLISNAVDAMPTGGKLGITLRRNDESVLLSVMDSGTGISSELEPKLFELFQTTKHNGTGLGLAFCKRAVEAHGGKISVDIGRESGASFNIYLPFS